MQAFGEYVYFRILGSLKVEATREVNVSALRPRIALASLLLAANHVVSVDRLVDAIWDEDPPSTAKGQVQICISMLRRILGEAGLDERINTRPPGYLLEVRPGELDLDVFNELVGRGRSALADGALTAASAALREAVSLFRGVPLAGIESRTVQAAAAQIAERRLSVLEQCIDLDLQLGRHHEVTDELTGLVNEYPLREYFTGQLMTALYRTGRQADALDVYRRTRRALDEGLGLEPSDALRQLERAILTRDADLELPPAALAHPLPASTPVIVPRMLPADIHDFTGHEQLVDDLVRYLAGGPSSAATVPVVFITGRGGVGKTTLAVHVSHRLTQAYPDGQLYVQLGGGRSPVGNIAEILERLLRALGVADSAIPDGLDARASSYRTQVAGRSMLVVLDDAADEGQVQHLLPGSPTCSVIVTSRHRLTAMSGFRTVEIDTLDPRDAIELLAALVGRERISAEPNQALKLVELCGRLPLALRIAAARLAARPHWTLGRLTERLADESRRLDELVHGALGVRASITLTYEALEPAARRLFLRLSILEANDFAGWVAAPLLDADAESATDVLESLVDTRLVDVIDGSGPTGRYRLHDLVRVYAHERLAAEEHPTDRLAAFKRVLGARLFLGECAHSLLYGGDYTIIHSQAPRWTLDGAVVDDLLHDPMRWYESERSSAVAAVLQAAHAGAADYCWDLAITMVTLFEARSYLDDWRRTHEAAMAVCQQTGDRLGEAAMLYSTGALNIFEQKHDQATARLTLALTVFEQLSQAHGQALTLRHLAFLHRFRGEADQAWARYEQALAGLRQAGDVAGEAHVLGGMAQIKVDQGEREAAARLLDEALRISTIANSSRVRAQVLHRLGELRLGDGELELAEENLSQALRAVRDTRDPLGEAYVLHGLGLVKLRQQCYGEATDMFDRGHTAASRSGDRMAMGKLSLAFGNLYLAQRDSQAAAAWVTRAIALFDEVGAHQAGKDAAALMDQIRRGSF
jgi:DNA-binding SARP family transcriptional activator